MSQGRGVPFLDLVAPHLELEEPLLDAVRGVIRSAQFVGGDAVEDFERQFADFCGVEHCVGVSSGTDALRFALIAAGIGRGDMVVTVPNTFVATVEAVIQAGATPQFVDIDSRTCNLSVDALGEFLRVECHPGPEPRSIVHRASGQSVRAVLPVHLYGQMCDMDPIMSLAEQHGLVVIEDACQAHGSRYYSSKAGSWLSAGSIGRAGAFSFYPGKNLGACGEAGAVTTNDAPLAARLRMIRDHGQDRKYHHLVEGYNGRLHALQAAILSVKLPYLNDWNDGRRSAAATYNELLNRVDGVVTPWEPEWSHSVYHLYVVRTDGRDTLQRRLTESGIGTGLHYPVPIHLQEAYRNLGYDRGSFPVAETCANQILSLPMFPQITEEQQDEVVAAVAGFSHSQAVSL